MRPRGAIPAQAAKCTPDQRQAPQILRSRARSEETDGAPKILMAPAVSSLHARALDAHSGFFTCCRGVFLHLLSRSVSSLVVAECFFTCCRGVFLHLLSGSVSSVVGGVVFFQFSSPHGHYCSISGRYLLKSVSSVVVGECFFTCCREVFLHFMVFTPSSSQTP